MIVRRTLLRSGGANNDSSILKRQLFDGNVWRRTGRSRSRTGGSRSCVLWRFSPRSAHARIIPNACRVPEQRHLRLVDFYVGYIQLLWENQRHYFHADAKRFRRQKRRWTELGV